MGLDGNGGNFLLPAGTDRIRGDCRSFGWSRRGMAAPAFTNGNQLNNKKNCIKIRINLKKRGITYEFAYI